MKCRFPPFSTAKSDKKTSTKNRSLQIFLLDASFALFCFYFYHIEKT